MKDDDKLGALQERHSELCARAADTGVKVPEALTVDFDTVEEGENICQQLEKLLADESAGVADAAEVVQDAPSKPKKAKKAKTTKPTAPAAAQQESDEMAKSAKKSVAKKAVKKVAKKSAAKKKAGAKKAAPKSGAAKAPRDTKVSKVSKVIAKLKNGGITRAEVLKMTGWKAVSMQALVKGTGLTLKQTDERPFRYTAK